MPTAFQRTTISFLLILLVSGCAGEPPDGTNYDSPVPSRTEAIPADALKLSPGDDRHPPILHNSEWKAPMPMPGPINSAGAEDSPFISSDGRQFFFFFTPDVRVPAEQQLIDGVTGIYSAQQGPDGWSEPARVILQDQGDLALDGCGFYQVGQLWFCTIRPGLMREIDIWLADFESGRASNWRSAGEALNLEVGLGEFHFTRDGQTVYFHSDRPDGRGGIDLWRVDRRGDKWSSPVNLVELNTSEHDGWPYITPNGRELYFTRTYLGTPAIYRSRRDGAGWSGPELLISQFAGEPTLDEAGNLYFVHHYFQDGVMLEADIYVAYRKQLLKSMRQGRVGRAIGVEA